ncbi:branched-chain amino acid ABC transporter permease [Rhodococcus sp. T7]|uniref:branched-chain amino acid ABC transporter permease n=1 Tax=Rhodococcus sp. T7 TaxID=627444 RepID=UPI0013578812|nr:branched-chain amino acid ABC transporter permease [Rhodococcus sp. T7]KAF0960272.1 hypothetical protein MLGJGCBP_06664 [Rhodococcus sp. T7]
MSDLALDPQPPALNTAQRLPDAASPRGSMRWSAGNIAWTALAVWALFAPFFIKASVLSIGLFVMAAAVGAIGLSLLTGSTGLLSLGHAFFIAVGAYGYAVLAGPPGAKVIGLGWPPLVAAIAAIGLAAIAGLLVSPIAARLKGIYLGIATFGLVFIGQHLLLNLTPLTGGFDGRSVTPFSLFGFEFSSASSIHVLGVRFGSEETSVVPVPGSPGRRGAHRNPPTARPHRSRMAHGA